MVVYSRSMARSRLRLRAGCLASILLCTSLARVAWADEARETLAEMLFREGTEKLDAGEIDPACEALTESLRLDQQLGTLLNLALCHEKQGKVASAWLEYGTGAIWAAAVGRIDRRDFAHQHASDLERWMSRVQLDLKLVPHPVVEIDGQPLSPSLYSLPIFLDPGAHIVTVRTPGKKLYRTYAIVPASTLPGQPGPTAQTITVPALGDAIDWNAVASVGEPVPRHVWWGARRIAGLGVASAGVVGLGIGAYFGVHSIVQLGDINAHCQGGTCDARGPSLHNQAKTSETVSLVALGAGAVAVGVGGFLWFAPRLRLGPTVIVEPVVGARDGGMTVLGTF